MRWRQKLRKTIQFSGETGNNIIYYYIVYSEMMSCATGK